MPGREYFDCQILSGNQFNESYGNVKLYKIPGYENGKLYFIDEKNLFYWLGDTELVYPVRIPTNAIVCIDTDRYLADKLIVGSPINIIKIPTFYQICLDIVSQNGWYLCYVPLAIRTKEMCLAAVRSYGWALTHVPDQVIDSEICLAAVQQNGLALEDVPDNLLTHIICYCAIKCNGWALQFVPDHMLNPETYMLAVQQNGLVLQIIPKKMKSETICLTAVQQNAQAIKFVPDRIKNLLSMEDVMVI
mgnify:CR=1 FL=1